MPTRPADADAAERVSYLYEPDAEAWRAWKSTVDRNTALYRRLDTLLEYDRDHDIDAMIEAMQADDAENVSLTALRIRRRCASGVQNARAEGADDAAEALAEIQALANQLLEGES